ncbi:hypothetical protein OG777_04220 [Micromonospora peucetia]|uniref:Uncharacterized protein n=1 Tax=Micromonospora peucetia TaxID=47871 RepID=A0A1C6U606_9ACTN|nr:hypothetical protein [Micromonospora peucetia]MCX4386133.1 hypothetical protein [Micromonospora peucetia]SCL49462.1 hypothetical protein GA0070608_0532 [Micromonospora peucetia]
MAITKSHETARVSSRGLLRTVSRRGLIASVPVVVVGQALAAGPALAQPRAVECLADLGAV